MTKRHYILISILLITLSLALSAGQTAFAEQTWYVNDSRTTLPAFFEGVYAIGSSGTTVLTANEAYALSGSGLYPLGSANAYGGGGLLYNDKHISITSDRVRVGLCYFYSATRDTSLSSAAVANSSGGFSIGCYDADGNFEFLHWTDASQLVLRPGADRAVNVLTSAGEVLFTYEATGPNNYLILRPDGEEDSASIAFNNNHYQGDMGFAVLDNGKLTVINVLDIEPYVMGVCSCEMSESWPVEALKAQAVAARTFAQKNIGASVYYYTCGFDLTADTYCQAYLGCDRVGKNIRQAVLETENQYLTYSGKLADALYSAADGGATESNQNVFGSTAHPYLVGIFDPYEASAANSNPYNSWRVVMTPAQFGSKVGISSVSDVTVTTSDTGNVIKLDIVSSSGQRATLIRDNCRTALGLKNIRYTITKDDSGNFVFEGSGFGHNVGMSQWGAYAMAKYFEKDYESILGFYYTKVGLSYGSLQ